MKKLVLSLSLVLPSPAQLWRLLRFRKTSGIGTDPTYAPFESKIQGELASISIWQRSCANASIRNVRLSKTHWMR